jgi:hypothetical protein
MISVKSLTSHQERWRVPNDSVRASMKQLKFDKSSRKGWLAPDRFN